MFYLLKFKNTSDNNRVMDFQLSKIAPICMICWVQIVDLYWIFLFLEWCFISSEKTMEVTAKLVEKWNPNHQNTSVVHKRVYLHRSICSKRDLNINVNFVANWVWSCIEQYRKIMTKLCKVCDYSLLCSLCERCQRKSESTSFIFSLDLSLKQIFQFQRVV